MLSRHGSRQGRPLFSGSLSMSGKFAHSAASAACPVVPGVGVGGGGRPPFPVLDSLLNCPGLGFVVPGASAAVAVYTRLCGLPFWVGGSSLLAGWVSRWVALTVARWGLSRCGLGCCPVSLRCSVGCSLGTYIKQKRRRFVTLSAKNFYEIFHAI